MGLGWLQALDLTMLIEPPFRQGPCYSGGFTDSGFQVKCKGSGRLWFEDFAWRKLCPPTFCMHGIPQPIPVKP